MNKTDAEYGSWEKSNIQTFWREVASCDHIVQIYENDNVFLNTLEGFAGDGFMKGESVIIIATQEHLTYLNSRLKIQGFDVDMLLSKDQYIPLNAEECILKFMVNNWPDEILFTKFVTTLMTRAQKNNRTIRAFGEMVAILWKQGHHDATVRLEILWHKLQQKNQFCVYCAYPHNVFTENAEASIHSICKTHSKIIDGNGRPSTEIYYKIA